MLFAYQKQYGIKIYIGRLHSIVGEYSKWKGQSAKVHSAIARKVAEVENNGTIEIIGDGTQSRTFLYVEDCVDAIIKLINSNHHLPINIGSDVNITINDYILLIKKISGKNFNVKYTDTSFGVNIRYCNIGNAKKILDWNPTTTIEESSKKTYNWICEQIKIN
jgi:nucleoside-diphosphate-sugar epimerase